MKSEILFMPMSFRVLLKRKDGEKTTTLGFISKNSTELTFEAFPAFERLTPDEMEQIQAFCGAKHLGVKND